MNELCPVDRLERDMLKLEQAPFKTIHRFSPGLYIREIQVPGNTFIVGHKHLKPCLNLFLKGRVQIFNEGGGTTILTAPMIFVSPPGRKAGYVLDDMVWLNVIPTTETDIEKIEAAMFDKSPAWKDTNKIGAKKCLE